MPSDILVRLSSGSDVFDLPSEFWLRLHQLVARLSICLALAGKLS